MRKFYTVATEKNRSTHIGNDVTTVFNTEFEFFESTSLVVTLVDDVTGIETVQALTTNYTVAGGAGSTGTVIMIVEPATGETLVIENNEPAAQGTDYLTFDPFDSETTEARLDRMMMVIHRALDLGGRAVKLPITDDPDNPADLTIPAPELDKVPVGNVAGDGWDNKTIAELGSPAAPLPLSIANGGTNSTTAANARTALDAQQDLDVPSEAEAEAGTATTERVWTAQRVHQAALAAIRGLGQCRLIRTSDTNIRLNPHKGNLIFINGQAEAVPSAGVNVGVSGLVADTNYNIYAYMNAGTMTLELSTTAHATDSTYGHEIKSGDATRTYVGNVRTDATPDFGATPSYADATGVRSWFNPIFYIWEPLYLFNDVQSGYTPADSAGAYAQIASTALSSGYFLQIPWNMAAKVEYARFSVLHSGSNTGNGVRVVHADDGPTNITQIAEVLSDGGSSPIHSASDITTSIQALQKDQSIFKHLGFEYKKVNTTTYDLFRVGVEILWAMDDARE
jgi:hypothetical protein